MYSADICLDKLRIQVSQDTEGLKLLVSNPDAAAPETSFPTDIALLAGVLEGYSYQVVSPDGSLSMTAEGADVWFQFSGNIGSSKCKTEKTVFANAIRDLRQSDV